MSNHEINKSEELFIVPDDIGFLAIKETLNPDKLSPELFFLESGENFVPYSKEEAKLVQNSVTDLIDSHFRLIQQGKTDFNPKYAKRILKKSTNIVADTEAYRAALLNPSWVEKRYRDENGAMFFKVNPNIRKFRFTAHILADYLLFSESLHAGSWPQPVNKHSPNSYDIMQSEKLKIVKAMTDQEYVDTTEKAYISLYNREQFHRKQIDEAKSKYSFFVPKILSDLKYI